MGQRAAETVKEIEETRERLTADIQELERRLPSPAVAARSAGRVAIGGSMGGAVAWFLIRRLRKRSMRRQAAVAGREAAQTIVQLVPERWAESLQGMRATPLAMGIAGAYVLLKMAELRRMRSLNKALLAAVEDTD